MSNARRIAKTLSPNDTGETGGHQAGMHIPKQRELLSFFPELDQSLKNPRATVWVVDESGGAWRFQFIYYNNKFFGGTRNEFRLTGMTRYIQDNVLKAGDDVVLERKDGSVTTISFVRQRTVPRLGDGAIRLGGGWKIVQF